MFRKQSGILNIALCRKKQVTWSALKKTLSTMNDSILNGYDEIQVALMEERCILTDQNDKVTGPATKKTCHLMHNINKGMLHRAFSVFLFNSEGNLLLQQRSDAKITFPGHFTNTCCSHPLYTTSELDGALGVKRAAQRKLQHELGIDPIQLSSKDLKFVTRVHYKAENAPNPGTWGEHEIDYILIAQKDVDIKPNPNEVKSHQYVDKRQLLQMIDKSQMGDIWITPWFRLIVDQFLMYWWENLHNIEQCSDQTIHRLLD
ncbi:isopentenyl-diphosphate Delta-isomerase 1-like isoform X2 [Ostrea edulis]|uniref:isopentenyl-diphosphate Delta-isomerase 1-like isoform X2 n=1 Tax=Ostrea edulis TaxID=37623 RepID=UPI0024AFCD90|nr:isopentenyl-diphosphate Delta-isomerase 1-like isoform X2 [Ostrea edulis]